MKAASVLTRLLAVAAQVQGAGGIVCVIDTKRMLDINEARSLGVRIDELLISQPDSPEQAQEIIGHLERSGAVDLITAVPVVLGGVR